TFELIEASGREAAPDDSTDRRSGDDVRDHTDLGERPENPDMGPPAGGATAKCNTNLTACHTRLPGQPPKRIPPSLYSGSGCASLVPGIFIPPRHGLFPVPEGKYRRVVLRFTYVHRPLLVREDQAGVPIRVLTTQ